MTGRSFATVTAL